MSCPYCSAPARYLYFNDGKLRSQVRCKVCAGLSQLGKALRKPKTRYWCPHCKHALYRWKQRQLVTIYKCDNDQCPAYLRALAKLNAKEQILRKKRSSQFKLRYQFREYHFTSKHLEHSKPEHSTVHMANIHHSANVVGLVLTFHVSFAIAARKTARILKQVFGIRISYQTVLNYAEAAAPYCHLVNLTYKGQPDSECAGDETYIKICGKFAYAFLFISVPSHKIMAYHLADSRETLPATAALQEAARTADPQKPITFITDGNPAYADGVHFLNNNRDPENLIQHHKVIGLQNLDSESEFYRHFKQISERLNRTYKYHCRAASGFKSTNGAVALTTLFVTHYNFLRPHMALNYKVPISIPECDLRGFLQTRWSRLIELGAKLA